jgi:thioredoxin reductase (NADPH)
MLTLDELAAIPILATLPPAKLDEIAKVAADIRLGNGDYAVHEGDDGALHAVLSGRLEITKRIDGVETPLGFRGPGEIFGEVPLVYGTQFQSSARAVEPSRVLRLDARHYHDLAADVPEIAAEVGKLAEHRLRGPKGLQGIAAERRKPQAVVLGNRWDATCLEFRRFLTRNQVYFEWLTPEDPDLRSRWGEERLPNPGECPVLRLADGTTLYQPALRELAERLGLQTEPKSKMYDTVIIGAGPAGLAAAVYGASEGLKTLVVEREAPGGQAGTSSRIENYLGFPNGVSGDELADRALRQARRLGAEILVTRAIDRIDSDERAIHLDGGETIWARTTILATGVSWRRLAIEGFDRLIGKGIYYGAARSEAGGTQGQDVHLIGAGNSAGQAAMFFANHARTVTLIVRGDSLEKSMSQYLVNQVRSKDNIKVALNSEVKGLHGDDHLTAVDIHDRAADARRTEGCGGLFVFIGADAETSWLPPEIVRDQRGYVLTGTDLAKTGLWTRERDPYLLETSVPGIFAAGDVRFSPVKRVAAAVGEGSMAIAFIHQYLKEAAAGRI